MRANTSESIRGAEVLILAILGITLLNVIPGTIYFTYLLVPVFIVVTFGHWDLVDRKFFVIIMFSALYPLSLLFNLNNDLLPGAFYFGFILFPSVFYLFGRYFMKSYPNARTLKQMAFFICFTFSLFPFIANLVGVLEGGFMAGRNIGVLFGNTDEAVNATNMGSFFALSLGLFPLLLLKKKNMGGITLRLIVIYLVGIALFSTLNMSNRTAILITALAISAYFIVTGNKRFFSVTFALTLVIALLISLDAWGLRDLIRTANLYVRFSDMSLHEELRFQYWQEALEYLFKHPFGQSSITDNSVFAHNLWIDVALRAGIIPVIPLVIFTVIQIADIIYLSRSAALDEITKGIILGFGVAFYVTFFLEPILEGYFLFFMIYFLYSGLLSGMRSYLNEETHLNLKSDSI